MYWAKVKWLHVFLNFGKWPRQMWELQHLVLTDWHCRGLRRTSTTGMFHILSPCVCVSYWDLLWQHRQQMKGGSSPPPLLSVFSVCLSLSTRSHSMLNATTVQKCHYFLNTSHFQCDENVLIWFPRPQGYIYSFPKITFSVLIHEIDK